MAEDFGSTGESPDELSAAAIQILHKELYKRTAMQIGVQTAEKITDAKSSEEKIRLISHAIEEAESITAEYVQKIAVVVLRKALQAKDRFTIPQVFSEKIGPATHILTDDSANEPHAEKNAVLMSSEPLEKIVQTLRFELAKETAVMLPLVTSKEVVEINEPVQRMQKILQIVEKAESATAHCIAQIAEAVVREAAQLHSSRDDMLSYYQMKMQEYGKIQPPAKSA